MHSATATVLIPEGRDTGFLRTIESQREIESVCVCVSVDALVKRCVPA